MTEEELNELRAYEPAGVARLLNMPITRLETWVREHRVPHQRAGVTRLVEFSAEDIRWIGRMRSHLMGGRRGGDRTGPPDQQQTAPAPAAGPGLSAETIAAWAELSAHSRSPKRSTR